MNRVKEMLQGIQTEIGAGMVLSPRNESDNTWNQASERARNIISNYIGGFGLFQSGVEVE